MKVRKPAFSGKFYPGTANELDKVIDRLKFSEVPYIDYALSQKNIIGGIVPHAGYFYSGYQAVHFYELLSKSAFQPETFIIINPNHTGLGIGNYNSCNCQFWETPYGEIEVDQEFSEAMDMVPTEMAHKEEHSGEVQLPFLQYFFKHEFKILVITQNRQNPECSEELAEMIYQTSQKLHRKIIVIASSDFSHYVNPEDGYKQDQYVVDEIMKFNTPNIYKEVKTHQVSTCGYGPMMVLTSYAKLAGKAPEMHILKRGHSGEIQVAEEVVDYISFLCTQE